MNQRIILDRRIAEDTWQLVPADGDIPPAGDIIVSLSRWLEERSRLLVRSGRTGVWLRPDEDPEKLARDLSDLPLVAVQFPQFTDGRGYSSARLLRERFSYKGELRAIGEVLRDQLFYLESVGFNAFAIETDKNLEDALAAFADFADAYQSSVARPVPYYRRRLGSAGLAQ